MRLSRCCNDIQRSETDTLAPVTSLIDCIPDKKFIADELPLELND
jgi:hypothetical protein